MLNDLVPKPNEYRPTHGVHLVGDRTVIGTDQQSGQAGWMLHDVLRGTGFRPPVLSCGDSAGAPTGGVTGGVTGRVTGDGAIVLRVDPDVSAHPEGYRLSVSPATVELTGASPAGIVRAVQTFRQLLPARALRCAPVDRAPVEIVCCVIEDAPRFDWRGVHLDVARHFMPKQFVMKLIDLAALHRMNVLHLHLTDDQGWRLEVPSRPRLTEIGSWRAGTVIGRGDEPDDHGRSSGNRSEDDGTPHGGYYTLDDLREIVSFAAERHVTVVPEIDLPGHVQAALAAYPELGNTGAAPEVRRRWGISEHVLAPTKESLEFARDVLDVVLDVFPGEYVHLGGDECPRAEWRRSPEATARATKLGLGSVDELQSWFMRQLSSYLTANGRRIVGWDEVLDDGGMPVDTVVMAWRNAERGLAAMKAGHEVVMAPQQVTYFDHYQSEDEDEPVALGGLSRLADVAGWEPVPDEGEALPGRILGVQGQLWTERLPDPRTVEYMAFPRLCALAEVGWVAAGSRNTGDVLRRITGHLSRLDALGVGYRPLDGPRPHQRGGTGRRRRPPEHGGTPARLA